jgi:hypothetical protein
VLFAGAGLALWPRIWNPDTLLHQPLPIYQLAERHITKAPGVAPRDYHATTLANADGGTVHFTVSLPHGTEAPTKGDRLPTLVLLTGFNSGRNSLAQIPNHGRNALIAYDYPCDQTSWKTASGV